MAATANAIEMLPAEALRKGRFDEIFYVGLPDAKAREEIFRIHMKKQNIDPSGFDLPLLASSPKRLSGAEIEQAIISALYTAFEEDRELNTEDVVAAVKQTVPLSVTMREDIGMVRRWAKGRARPASRELRSSPLTGICAKRSISAAL